MQSIYILSTPSRARKNMFKPGKHLGTKSKLIARYITPLIKPVVYYFQYVNDYDAIEKKILEKLDEFRVLNINGRKSEWVKCPLTYIIEVADNVIAKFNASKTSKKTPKQCVSKSDYRSFIARIRFYGIPLPTTKEYKTFCKELQTFDAIPNATIYKWMEDYETPDSTSSDECSEDGETANLDIEEI